MDIFAVLVETKPPKQSCGFLMNYGNISIQFLSGQNQIFLGRHVDVCCVDRTRCFFKEPLRHFQLFRGEQYQVTGHISIRLLWHQNGVFFKETCWHFQLLLYRQNQVALRRHANVSGGLKGNQNQLFFTPSWAISIRDHAAQISHLKPNSDAFIP